MDDLTQKKKNKYLPGTLLSSGEANISGAEGHRKSAGFNPCGTKVFLASAKSNKNII